MKHTPTPWAIEPNGSCFNVLRESSGNEHHLILVGMLSNQEGEHEANAAFIVRACNAHEELLAALQEIIHMANGDPESVIQFAKQAIAKAEGSAT